MLEVRLGRTGIVTSKNAFGALPIQRVPLDEAVDILRAAYDGGIRFFDTAHAYSDSEEKLGVALADRRGDIILATKTNDFTTEGFWQNLNQSLAGLRTEYVDLLQFHNPDFCPLPGDGTGLYEAMLEARDKGLIRFIGLTNHRPPVAQQAVDSGLYDTLQFPFSYLSGEAEQALVHSCAAADIGFIAMKALSGGLLTDAGAAYGFMAGFENVLPIWGIQRREELDEFLALDVSFAGLTGQQEARIKADRAELAGAFCRGCGYCMPCPVGIEINMAARMSLLLRRSPAEGWLGEAMQEKMARVNDCLECGRCKKACPYSLDIPPLLRRNYADYKTFL